jgi:predicted nucleic acid-binding Zn ribbon protein
MPETTALAGRLAERADNPWHGYWCTGCGCAVEVVRHEGDGVVECGACGEWAIAVWT